MIYYRRNANKKLPKRMLEYLLIHNNYVTSVWMEAISNTKYQLQQFHTEKN